MISLLKRRILGAGGNSIKGWIAVLRNEEAVQIEVLLSFILLPLAVWLSETPNQLLWLVFSVVLVILVELLNTAIEAAIDRIGTERNPLSGLAKDVGSAAVFTAMMFLLFVWGVVLWQIYM